MTISSRVKDLLSSSLCEVVPSSALLHPRHPPPLPGLEPPRDNSDHQPSGSTRLLPVSQQLQDATCSRC